MCQNEVMRVCNKYYLDIQNNASLFLGWHYCVTVLYINYDLASNVWRSLDA